MNIVFYLWCITIKFFDYKLVKNKFFNALIVIIYNIFVTCNIIYLIRLNYLKRMSV